MFFVWRSRDENSEIKLKYLQISISDLEEPKKKSNPTPHISDEETTGRNVNCLAENEKVS